MAEDMWEPIKELPSKLEVYGQKLTPRFMDSKSPLYQPQKEALACLVEWFSNPDTKDSHATIVMPTGTGKSGVICCLPYVIGGAIADGRISRKDIDITKPILVIAPGLDILDQLRGDLNFFLVEMGLLLKVEQNLRYGVFLVQTSADIAGIPQKRDDVILSNAQKWQLEGTPSYEDLPGDLFSVVIVDEAHYLPAKQWDEIARKFQDNAKVILFAATPDRYDGRPVSSSQDKFGLAYQLVRKEAVEMRLIRDVQMTVLRYSAKISTPQQTLNYSEEPQEYAREVVFKVLACVEKKNKTTPLPGNKKHAAIIIAKDKQDADHVKEMCLENFKVDEEKVIVIHSALKGKRKEEIEKIRSGQYEVVVIVEMLSEGFNYPPFSVAGIVTRIRSGVKFVQFVGRVQRLVRYRGEDGTLQTEEGVKGDVITHEYFEQDRLFKEYISPTVK